MALKYRVLSPNFAGVAVTNASKHADEFHRRVGSQWHLYWQDCQLKSIFFPEPWLKFHFFLEDIVLVFIFEVGTARAVTGCTSCDPVIVIFIVLGSTQRQGTYIFAWKNEQEFTCNLIGGNLAWTQVSPTRASIWSRNPSALVHTDAK